LGSDADGPTLLDIIAANDGDNPLSLLELAEMPEEPAPQAPDPCHSEVAAWHWLVLRFDRRMADLAAYLLISTSWCRRRRCRARRYATAQWPLAHRIASEACEQAEALQPWRRFKLPPQRAHTETQMRLDYWGRPAQPRCGQLWLL
jgi:hypothetical protein